MQCDVCQQNDATVFLTQIVGGKMQKVNLCESCYKEKGIDDPAGFELTDLLKGIVPAQSFEKAATSSRCPVCGFTQADLKKTARLGCSACYDVFIEDLDAMLKNMHKGSEHIGKAPATFLKTRKLSQKIKSLQTNLDKAVAAEQYEKAADLRDQIRKIEGGITA